MSLKEQWKYERAYELGHYRMGVDRMNYAMVDVESMVPGSLYLDVGCGRGEMVKYARRRNVLAMGVDATPQLCDDKTVFHGDICALPFPEKQFDYVSCYDVLEHLPPGEEQQALDELGRVCRGWLFISTNDRPSHLPDGTDLHVNKRSRTEWHADLLKRWGPKERMWFAMKGPKRDWHWTIKVGE